MHEQHIHTHQFNEHPVGNAMPAWRPFSDINLRTIFSKVSHRSIINIPGFKICLIYLRTWTQLQGCRNGRKEPAIFLSNQVGEIFISSGCSQMRTDMSKHTDKYQSFSTYLTMNFRCLANGIVYWFFQALQLPLFLGSCPPQVTELNHQQQKFILRNLHDIKLKKKRAQ